MRYTLKLIVRGLSVVAVVAAVVFAWKVLIFMGAIFGFTILVIWAWEA